MAQRQRRLLETLVYLGRPVIDCIRPAALDRIEEEARRVEFWDGLPRIACPVLILGGLAASSAIPSDLSAEDSLRYRSLLRNAEEVGFEHSGHMIPDEEPEKYAGVVRDFLAKLDRRIQKSDGK